MSRHAGPPGPPDSPSVPEPTFAERARTLVDQARTGTLATISRRHPGHPFASVMPYALDGDGGPLLLISSMAIHTQNLHGDARASLLVTQPGSAGDPLAAGRVTMMGEARRVGADETAGVRAAYLERHASAAYWADFEDFSFWRLEAADYRRVKPDPLADAAAGIMEHMNRDHADALVAYARFFASAEADEATMAAVDRLGFKLQLRQGRRRWSVRVAFPREVTTAGESREVLIEMLKQARGQA
ncbi:MAG: pyridoxamine 5'-phosphate oxidase [Candidatus Rokuibacteriota bacterium]|nr:MAG: pyridoxamine 5'-phosphate oxidase [Candidatus Rokubacteria bacterium]